MFEFFTEEQKVLQQVVREYVNQEVAPHAERWDFDDDCPVDVIRQFGQLGYLGVFVPEKDGGAGLGITERAIIIEEVARHSAGLAIALMTHDGPIAALSDFGTEEQKARFLPDLLNANQIGNMAFTEPTGGSDFMTQSTTIAPVEGGFILNGRKMFITNSHITELGLWCGTGGVNEKGRPIINVVVVPPGTEGMSFGRKENKLGLRGSVTGDVIANNAFIPEDCLLGGVGRGARIALGTISKYGRSAMAAICVGILRGCCEEAIKFSQDRIVYGKPISQLHPIQMAIAQNLADYQAAHAMLYNALAVSDRGDTAEATPRIAAAKLFSTHAAIRAAERTMELMGGYGVINEYPVGRFLRDALASVPSGGTSHVMGMIIASAATAS